MILFTTYTPPHGPSETNGYGVVAYIDIIESQAEHYELINSPDDFFIWCETTVFRYVDSSYAFPAYGENI